MVSTESAEKQGGVKDDDDDDNEPDGEIRERDNEGFSKISHDEVFWPKDLLPQIFPKARIMTWGYDVQISSLLTAASEASLLRHAETLLNDLAGKRVKKHLKERPIIFIAHSLGGIVVKDALNLSKNENTFLKEIFSATKGVMFLGTPHRGSKMASIGKLAATFVGSPLRNLLATIERNTELLERTRKNFNQLLDSGRIMVHSFQEELPWKGIMIVPQSSSTTDSIHESRSLLHANHRNMAKMASINDLKFQRITSILIRWVQQISDAPDTSICIPSDTRILTEQYKVCLESLSVLEAARRFQNVETPFTGTFDWLFNDKLGFTDFLKGRTSDIIFWIQGKPGSGKSTAMKYAMCHQTTRWSLSQFDDNDWIVASYFFHDRGSAVQKSIDGFLRETLYQILIRRKDVFPYVYPVFSSHLSVATLDKTDQDRSSLSTNMWSSSKTLEALLSIGQKTEANFNLCLFVDALDEHGGKHDHLLSVFEQLETITDNPSVHLRICAASRPENIFRTKFKNYLGFAIHDHTSSDIRRYTESRMHEHTSDTLTDEGMLALNTLIESVIRRAHGVFLWVKLVVDELAEGLREGDLPQEMEELLSTIPDELSSLYARAIRRPRRSTPRVSQKLETYIMFQLAISAELPLSLHHFLSASFYLSSGQDPAELSLQSHHQLESRLYSRSCGLLETAGPSYEETVQFIHQTANEFLKTEAGRMVMNAIVETVNHETGDRLMLRYAAYLLSNFAMGSQSTTEETFVLRNFIHYARRVELDEGVNIGQFAEPAILKLSTEEQCNALMRILDLEHSSPRASLLMDANSSRWYQLLVFYALFGFPLSLSRCLDEHFLPLHVVNSEEQSLRLQDTLRLIEAALLSLNDLSMGSQLIGTPTQRDKSPEVLLILLEQYFKTKRPSRGQLSKFARSFRHLLTQGIEFKTKRKLEAFQVLFDGLDRSQ